MGMCVDTRADMHADADTHTHTHTCPVGSVSLDKPDPCSILVVCPMTLAVPATAGWIWWAPDQGQSVHVLASC